MALLCTQEKFDVEFGKYKEEAYEVLTKKYNLLSVNDSKVYVQFDLFSLFNEQVDLFSVDPSLIDDTFLVQPNFFSDESINPDVIFTLVDLLQDAFNDSINEDGYLWFTFSDLRAIYGEDQFDVDMDKLFPEDYPIFKEFLLE